MHWAWAVGMQSETEGLLELEESDIEVLDDIWKGTNSSTNSGIKTNCVCCHQGKAGPGKRES